MPLNFASLLLTLAIVAAILPPGYPAYIGAYAALTASILALLAYGWRQRSTLSHPTSRAILGAVALLAATVPFVYLGPQDLLAPVMVLPMLATIALGMLARPASWVPNVTTFASICLVAALIALAGGLFEYFALGTYRPGLGNNPIHFATLAAISGSLAMVGVVAGHSPWRYLFLLGPVFGLGAVAIADSRGPMVGALAMLAIGILILTIWLWSDKLFRTALFATMGLAASIVAYLSSVGSWRVTMIFNSATNIFRFTGGPDDIRTALYVSALESLKASPIVGVGLGQIMVMAKRLFPEQPAAFTVDNLHSDWANFGTMAGGLGLIAWLLLLAAPLLLLLERNARQDRPILLGVAILTTGQFVLGISNATFGILPQTTIYAVMLGYFLVRASRLSLEFPAIPSRAHPWEAQTIDRSR